MSLALGRLGFVSCRHLFKSGFASGYCTLIKKAELTVSSENMQNALCYGKPKLSPGERDNVRGEHLELIHASGFNQSHIPQLRASKHIFCLFCI